MPSVPDPIEGVTTPPTPRIHRSTWTYDLTGICVYCNKGARRTFNYFVAIHEEADAAAEKTLRSGIWHRKCGGC